MKRLAAALMICGTVLGGAAIAEAQDYPPAENPSADLEDATPAPGSTFSVTIENCIPGETVNWNFQGQVVTNTCMGASAGGFGFLLGTTAGGTATAEFVAPTTSGTYTGTAALVQSGTVVTFTVTVEGAAGPTTTAGTPVSGIPATGAGSTMPTLTIAGVLLAAGVGLFLVAQFRRREATTG